MNRKRIGLVFPVLPPLLNGIGDYTARLAETIGSKSDCIVFCEAGDFDPIPNARMAPCASRFSDDGGLLAQVAKHPVDRLLIQYNPFSYGRWGLNLRFPETVRALKKQHPTMQIGLMVHEAFVPLEGFKQSVMTTWQRYQLLRLGRSVDLVFFSISPWARRFQKWFPRKRVLHAPVGSNIPVVDISRSEARARLGISEHELVLGAFGSDHESRQWDWVVDAAEAVYDRYPNAKLLYAGSAGEIVRSHVNAVPFESLGRLSASDLSIAIASMDIFLSPFQDGVSSRKGSAIVALQHGVATALTQGKQTDQLFVDANLGITPNDNKSAFVQHVLTLAAEQEYREQIASNGRALHDRVFEWETVANVFDAAFSEQGG